MRDERICLKIKIKSLAAEAKIIRLEEKRIGINSIRESLYRHRIDVVRHEARHTQLAYCFLRGLNYKKIEPNAKSVPDWAKVRKMVEKYGTHLAPWSISTEKHVEYEARCKEEKKQLADVLKRFDEWVANATKKDFAVGGNNP